MIFIDSFHSLFPTWLIGDALYVSFFFFFIRCIYIKSAWSCVQRYWFYSHFSDPVGCRGTWLADFGLAGPLAGLRVICLHKMADKLFTCKYELRAWEAWRAFPELPVIPILCLSHSKKQPGLSLDFSAKGMEILAKFIFNPRLLGDSSRIHGTIWEGSCEFKEGKYQHPGEKVIHSCASNFCLFRRKRDRSCFVLDSSNWSSDQRNSSLFGFPFLSFVHLR